MAKCLQAHPSATANRPRPSAWDKRVTDILAIRVWKQPLVSFDSGEQGGFAPVPKVGSPDAIAGEVAANEYQWLHSRQYFFGEAVLTALVALLSLVGWLRNREQRVLLWMAVFCGAWVCTVLLVDLRLPFSFNFGLGWLQPVLGLRDVGLWFLLLWLLQLNGNRRLARFTCGLAIVTMVTSSLDGMLSAVNLSSAATAHAEQVADGVLTAIFTLSELYAPVLVILGSAPASRSFALVGGDLRPFVADDFCCAHRALTREPVYPLEDWQKDRLAALHHQRQSLQLVHYLPTLPADLHCLCGLSLHAAKNSGRQQAVEQDLLGAQELQRVLIPDSLPSLPGFSLTSAYRPAQEVGGDFFQIIPLENDSIGLYPGRARRRQWQRPPSRNGRLTYCWDHTHAGGVLHQSSGDTRRTQSPSAWPSLWRLRHLPCPAPQSRWTLRDRQRRTPRAVSQPPGDRCSRHRFRLE